MLYYESNEHIILFDRYPRLWNDNDEIMNHRVAFIILVKMVCSIRETDDGSECKTM